MDWLLLMFPFRGDVPQEGQKGSQDIQVVEQRAGMRAESVSLRCTELHQQRAVQHAHAASPGPGGTFSPTFLFFFHEILEFLRLLRDCEIVECPFLRLLRD